MTITMTLPLVVSVAGALVYGFSANTKAGYLGLGAFVAGLTAFLVRMH